MLTLQCEPCHPANPFIHPLRGCFAEAARLVSEGQAVALASDSTNLKPGADLQASAGFGWHCPAHPPPDRSASCVQVFLDLAGSAKLAEFTKN